MSIPDTVKHFLEVREVPFDVLSHNLTATSAGTAESAHVPGDQVAKAVVLEDGATYVMAIIPATHRLDPGALWDLLGRRVRMVEETDFVRLFKDCRIGAVPPLGPAYGLETVVDRALLDQPDVYLEGGDHEHIIHLSGLDFGVLMSAAPRGHISYRV